MRASDDGSGVAACGLPDSAVGRMGRSPIPGTRIGVAKSRHPSDRAMLTAPSPPLPGGPVLLARWRREAGFLALRNKEVGYASPLVFLVALVLATVLLRRPARPAIDLDLRNPEAQPLQAAGSVRRSPRW